jgi:hypothetical protein
MEKNEVAKRVLEAVRGNDAAIQEISRALLSKDAAQIKRTFSQVAGVDLTDEQVETLIQDYSTQEKIAAST